LFLKLRQDCPQALLAHGWSLWLLKLEVPPQLCDMPYLEHQSPIHKIHVTHYHQIATGARPCRISANTSAGTAINLKALK
jgi:hypothetical protein